MFTRAVKGVLWLALFDMSGITNEYFPLRSSSTFCLSRASHTSHFVCVCVSELLLTHSHPLHILPLKLKHAQSVDIRVW